MLRSVSPSMSSSSWQSLDSAEQLSARSAPQAALDVGILFQSLWGYLRYVGAPKTIEVPLERQLKNRVTVSMWLGESRVDSRIKAPWKQFLLTGSSDGNALRAVQSGLQTVSGECVDAELSSLRALLAVFVGQPLKALEDRASLVGEIHELFTFLPADSSFRKKWDVFYANRSDSESILLPRIFRLRELFQEVYFPDSDDDLLASSSDDDSDGSASDPDDIDSMPSSTATSSPNSELFEVFGPHDSFVVSPNSSADAASESSSEPPEVFGPHDSFVVSPDSSADAASVSNESSLESNQVDTGRLSVIEEADEEDDTESVSSSEDGCSTILEVDENELPVRSASDQS